MDSSIKRYLERSKVITLTRARMNPLEEKATKAEKKSYQNLACALLYLGSSALPQAVSATSSLQQRAAIFKVGHYMLASEMARELLTFELRMRFIKATGIKIVRVCTFSNAYFNQKHMND